MLVISVAPQKWFVSKNSATNFTRKFSKSVGHFNVTGHGPSISAYFSTLCTLDLFGRLFGSPWRPGHPGWTYSFVTDMHSSTVHPSHGWKIVNKQLWLNAENLDEGAQCGNFRIFLSPWFYVKSFFRDSRRAKSAVLIHLEAVSFEFHEFLHFLKVKLCWIN